MNTFLRVVKQRFFLHIRCIITRQWLINLCGFLNQCVTATLQLFISEFLINPVKRPLKAQRGFITGGVCLCATIPQSMFSFFTALFRAHLAWTQSTVSFEMNIVCGYWQFLLNRPVFPFKSSVCEVCNCANKGKYLVLVQSWVSQKNPGFFCSLRNIQIKGPSLRVEIINENKTTKHFSFLLAAFWNPIANTCSTRSLVTTVDISSARWDVSEMSLTGIDSGDGQMSRNSSATLWNSRI